MRAKQGTPACGTCKYFVQHYGRKSKGNFLKVNFGHCIYPRIKIRQPLSAACEHYKSAQSDDDLLKNKGALK